MAQDARLLKTIRNVVLVWVKRANLNPVEFEWKKVKARDRTRTGYSNDFLMSILTHKPTKFYYRFGPFIDKYSPGSETQTDSRDHSGSWDHRFSLIEDWLRFLKKEYEAPDLWQMLLEESKHHCPDIISECCRLLCWRRPQGPPNTLHGVAHQGAVRG